MKVAGLTEYETPESSTPGTIRMETDFEGVHSGSTMQLT